MRIKEISIENLIDPKQIGWVIYEEGDATIKCKVIRGDSKFPFLSQITGYAKRTEVRAVEYDDEEMWKIKSQYLLRAFKKQVGKHYYYNYMKDVEGIIPGKSK